MKKPPLSRFKRKPHENWQARIWRMLGIAQLVDQGQLQRNLNYLHFAGAPCPKYKRAKVPIAHHHLVKPKFHAIKFKNKELVFVFHQFAWLDDYRCKLTPRWTRTGTRRSIIVNCVTAQIEWGNHRSMGPMTDPIGILRGGLPRAWDGVGEHFVLGVEFLEIESCLRSPKDDLDYKDDYTSGGEDEV